MVKGPIPKPDSERVNRVKKPFDWVDLPPNGNPLPPPAMPKLPPKKVPAPGGSVTMEQQWPDFAEEAWQRIWKSPQSTQWNREDHYSIAEQWLHLYVSFKNGDLSGTTLTTLQRIEDKLGLNPKAMLQLRWRYGADVVEPERKLAAVTEMPTKRVDPRG